MFEHRAINAGQREKAGVRGNTIGYWQWIESLKYWRWQLRKRRASGSEERSLSEAYVINVFNVHGEASLLGVLTFINYMWLCRKLSKSCVFIIIKCDFVINYSLYFGFQYWYAVQSQPITTHCFKWSKPAAALLGLILYTKNSFALRADWFNVNIGKGLDLEDENNISSSLISIVGCVFNILMIHCFTAMY